MEKEKVEIRSLRPEEFPQLLNFWTGRHASTKEDLESDYRNDPYYKYEHSRVCVVDGKIVSNARIYERPMRVGSIIMRNGGIGNVFTEPDFRGRGYATALLQDAFQYMKEHDFDLSIILGIRLYGQVGWAIFPQDIFSIKIIRGRFPHKWLGIPLCEDYKVRRFERANDLKTVMRVYDAYCQGRSVTIARSKEYWQRHFYWLRREREAGFLVAERDGKIVAYIRMQGTGSEMNITEACYLTEDKEAMANLFDAAYRFAMANRCETLSGYLPLDHPLGELFLRCGGGHRHFKHSRPPEPDGRGGGGMFFRLIDLERLLKKLALLLTQRLTEAAATRPFSIGLKVVGQAKAIEFDGQKVEIRPFGAKDKVLDLEQTTFFKLILGYSLASEMNFAEKYGLSEEDVAVLDALFPRTYPIFWRTDYY